MNDAEISAALAAAPSPDRVTPEVIEARIGTIEFYRIGGTLTVCVLTLDNGFSVTGESACADPANFNKELGQELAERQARAKLWPLFGFLLKEAMYRRDGGR
jgi:hypothetical protein